MNTKLHIGFKGKNNASYILVKSISTDSYLLTNSFEGLKRDIENLDYSYDCVILFGIDLYKFISFVHSIMNNSETP